MSKRTKGGRIAQSKQRVIWLYTMPGSSRSTQKKAVRHSNGRIPVFTSEKLAYRYMISRWQLKPGGRGKRWFHPFTGGELIIMSFQTPYHKWREMRLTKNHVIDPVWQKRQ